MQYISALQRLTATEVQGEGMDVEAQFDSGREEQLRRIQGQLRKHGLVFSMGGHHLFHKSNDGDIATEAEQTADVLNGIGYELRILHGIYAKPTYALKGRDGIVLQKVQSALRIFFSI